MTASTIADSDFGCNKAKERISKREFKKKTKHAKFSEKRTFLNP